MLGTVRRTIDLVVANCAVLYYIYVATRHLNASQMSVYLCAGIGGVAMFYGRARYLVPSLVIDCDRLQNVH